MLGFSLALQRKRAEQAVMFLVKSADDPPTKKYLEVREIEFSGHALAHILSSHNPQPSIGKGLQWVDRVFGIDTGVYLRGTIHVDYFFSNKKYF
jgi:hypothetical protein